VQFSLFSPTTVTMASWHKKAKQSTLTKADLKRIEDLHKKVAADKVAVAKEKVALKKQKKEIEAERKKLAGQWKELKNARKQAQLGHEFKVGVAQKEAQKAAKGGQSGNLKRLQEQLLEMKTKLNHESKRARQHKMEVDQLSAENKVLHKKLKNLQNRKGKGEDPRVKHLAHENKMLKKQLKLRKVQNSASGAEDKAHSVEPIDTAVESDGELECLDMHQVSSDSARPIDGGAGAVGEKLIAVCDCFTHELKGRLADVDAVNGIFHEIKRYLNVDNGHESPDRSDHCDTDSDGDSLDPAAQLTDSSSSLHSEDRSPTELDDTAMSALRQEISARHSLIMAQFAKLSAREQVSGEAVGNMDDATQEQVRRTGEALQAKNEEWAKLLMTQLAHIKRLKECSSKDADVVALAAPADNPAEAISRPSPPALAPPSYARSSPVACSSPPANQGTQVTEQVKMQFAQMCQIEELATETEPPKDDVFAQHFAEMQQKVLADNQRLNLGSSPASALSQRGRARGRGRDRGSARGRGGARARGRGRGRTHRTTDPGVRRYRTQMVQRGAFQPHTPTMTPAQSAPVYQRPVQLAVAVPVVPPRPPMLTPPTYTSAATRRRRAEAEALRSRMNPRDDPHVCWEFNTWAGCPHGKDCTYSHRYLANPSKHHYTKVKLIGIVERYMKDPDCLKDPSRFHDNGAPGKGKKERK